MSDKQRAPKGFPLAEPERARLGAAVRSRGIKVVQRACGLSRNGLSNALAGLPILAGTAALVERGLAKLDADDARQRIADDLAGAEVLLSRRGMP
jgi:hypothetical protein